MSTERQNKVYLICGVNGTGKTQFVRKFIDKGTRRALILNPTFEPKWDRYPKIKVDDAEAIRTFEGIKQLQPRYAFGKMKKSFIQMLQIMWDNYENGVLVLDDCREMFEANLVSEVGSIMRGYRQHNLDVFAIFHSISQIPPKFFDHCNGYLVIFKTQDSEDRFVTKLPGHKREVILNTWKRVVSKAEENEHYCEFVKM